MSIHLLRSGIAASARRPYLLDTFTRADGALGAAEVGGAWLAGTGTFGIVSGKAVCTALGGSFAAATLNAPQPDVTVSATFVTPTAGTGIYGLVWRYVDAANFWVTLFNAGMVQNYSVTAGAFGAAPGGTFARVGGVAHTLAVSVVGTTATVSVNGVQVVAPFTVTARATATRVGLYSQSASGLYTMDGFSAVVP